MDVFLDMTGTITDMESENYALYKLAESIKIRFSIELPTENILVRIEDYRKPYMEKRDVEYIPVRNLIVEGTRKIVGNLSKEDEEWLSKQYVDIHAKYVKLQKNSVEGLRKIRNIAEHMGMITDADRPYTEGVLKALHISQFFDSVITAEDVGVGKPNPRIFEEAIRKTSGKIKIYIGDSEKRDMRGAKGVGMIAVKIGKNTKYGDFFAPDLFEAAKIIENRIINPPP